ncbi:KN motif and ankyrin repeat domains 1-like [Phyllobates terribilis]|uniref:KN motif and ankyrin repeat domains 1-like n=1 Tax=Phyllobates terribilis TaxID=111132 RepID=UPI003CCAC7AD
MTESVNLRDDLPGNTITENLGGPFLYWDQNENEKVSYSVETPYGFQLDLDFLKYVNDIQSGQTLKKLQGNRKPRMPRRSTSSLRSLSSQTGAWVSTESLSYNEDGTSDSVFFTGRTEINSLYTKETLTLKKSNPLSPMPIFKLLLPPPAKNFVKSSEVEKTLQETSRRLQQEHLNLHHVSMQTVSHQTSNLSKLSNASRSSPNLTQTSLTTDQNKSGEAHARTSQSFTGSLKRSPISSGRSSPAANISPAHLQYIREQMAASLKRLKDLEDQAKIIPALQMKISRLERENKQLTYDLEKQKASKVNNGQTSVADRNLGGKKKAGEKQFGHLPAVKVKTRKSVAVGDDVSIADSVFYYRSRQGNKDVALQASPETKDVGEWVMESLLGLSSDVEKEIQLFQHTVEHQRSVINMLEDHVKAAADELEELRIAVASRKARCLVDEDIIRQTDPAESLLEASIPHDRELPEVGLKMVDTNIICSSFVDISDSINASLLADIPYATVE